MGFKQTIVLRTDLGMSIGKMVAQACHACLGAVEEARKTRREWLERWMETGQKKITLAVDSEEKIIQLYEKARRLGLPCFLVRDAGYTELPPGTITALGVGPAPEELVDKVTGNLPLLR